MELHGKADKERKGAMLEVNNTLLDIAKEQLEGYIALWYREEPWMQLYIEIAANNGFERLVAGVHNNQMMYRYKLNDVGIALMEKSGILIATEGVFYDNDDVSVQATLDNFGL